MLIGLGNQVLVVLGDNRDELALLLPHVARRRLDAPRERVDHEKEQRRDRERDEREAPVEVQHHTDGWTVEVRLPRRSLPLQAEEWPIWAINFSRFQARLAEYSNWAGAKRHVYSPLSMGNLIWPQGIKGAMSMPPDESSNRPGRRADR